MDSREVPSVEELEGIFKEWLLHSVAKNINPVLLVYDLYIQKIISTDEQNLVLQQMTDGARQSFFFKLLTSRGGEGIDALLRALENGNYHQAKADLEKVLSGHNLGPFGPPAPTVLHVYNQLNLLLNKNKGQLTEEQRKMQELLAQKEEELEEKQRRIAKLKARIKELEREREEAVQEEREKFDAEIAKARAEIAELKWQADEGRRQLELEKKTKEEAVRRMEENVQDLERQVEFLRLQGEREKDAQSLRSKEIKKAEEAKRIGGSSGNKTEIAETVQCGPNINLVDLITRMVQMEMKQKLQDEKIEKLTKAYGEDIEKLQEKVTEVETKFEEKLNSVVADVRECQNDPTFAKIDLNLTQINREIEKLKETKRELAEKTANLDQRAARFNLQLTSFERTIGTLTGRLNDQNAKFNKIAEAFPAKIEGVNTKLDQKMANFERSIATLSGRLNDEDQRAARFDLQLTDFERTIGTLTGRLDDQNAKLNEIAEAFPAKIDAVHAKTDINRAQLINFEQSIGTLTERMNDQDGKLNEIAGAFPAKIEAVDTKINQQLTSFEQSIATLTGQLTDQNARLEAFPAKIEAVKTKVDKNQAEVKKTLAELKKARQRIDDEVVNINERLKQQAMNTIEIAKGLGKGCVVLDFKKMNYTSSIPAFESTCAGGGTGYGINWNPHDYYKVDSDTAGTYLFIAEWTSPNPYSDYSVDFLTSEGKIIGSMTCDKNAGLKMSFLEMKEGYFVRFPNLLKYSSYTCSLIGIRVC